MTSQDLESYPIFDSLPSEVADMARSIMGAVEKWSQERVRTAHLAAKMAMAGG